MSKAPGFIIEPSAPQPAHNPSYPAYPSAAGQPPPYPTNYPAPQQQPYYPPQSHNHGQPFPAPINQQPVAFLPQGGGSGLPSANWSNNAPFHNYLIGASSFHVKQKVELFEAIVGWETGNKYTVKDQSGNKVFYVGEESGCCPRQFCASSRPFTLTVKDPLGSNALVFDRPIDCSCCFGLCCQDSVTVSSPNGQLLGTVISTFNILYPTYELKNSVGNTVLKIRGPFCPTSFGRCNAVVFKVTNNSDITVGTISKEWGGLVRELFTDADYFSMSFPQDLDPAMKAVCLGALFLIDFQFFEAGSDGKQGGRRLFG